MRGLGQGVPGAPPARLPQRLRGAAARCRAGRRLGLCAIVHRGRRELDDRHALERRRPDRARRRDRVLPDLIADPGTPFAEALRGIRASGFGATAGQLRGLLLLRRPVRRPPLIGGARRPPRECRERVVRLGNTRRSSTAHRRRTSSPRRHHRGDDHAERPADAMISCAARITPAGRWNRRTPDRSDRRGRARPRHRGLTPAAGRAQARWRDRALLRRGSHARGPALAPRPRAPLDQSDGALADHAELPAGFLAHGRTSLPSVARWSSGRRHDLMLACGPRLQTRGRRSGPPLVSSVSEVTPTVSRAVRGLARDARRRLAEQLAHPLAPPPARRRRGCC